jgi:hypothetical protein
MCHLVGSIAGNSSHIITSAAFKIEQLSQSLKLFRTVGLSLLEGDTSKAQ